MPAPPCPLLGDGITDDTLLHSPARDLLRLQLTNKRRPSRSVVQTVLCCADTALGATRAMAARARVFIMVGERTRVLAAAALLDVTGARRNSDGHFEGPHQLANE